MGKRLDFNDKRLIANMFDRLTEDGHIKPLDESKKVWKYAVGWSDHRVLNDATNLGVTATLTQVQYVRREVLGNLHSGRSGSSVAARLEAIEERLARLEAAQPKLSL